MGIVIRYDGKILIIDRLTVITLRRSGIRAVIKMRPRRKSRVILGECRI